MRASTKQPLSTIGEFDWTANDLAAYLARHNRRVVFSSFATIILVAGLWFLLYFAMIWLTMLVLTIVRGMDAPQHLPDWLPVAYLSAAFLLVAVSWATRQRRAMARPRDGRPIAEHLLDFALALPRATVVAWENIGAWCNLRRHELEPALALLERLHREGRVAVRTVPVDIPDRRMRKKIIVSCQLAGLLEMDHIKGNAWLRLNPEAIAEQRALAGRA